MQTMLEKSANCLQQWLISISTKLVMNWAVEFPGGEEMADWLVEADVRDLFFLSTHHNNMICGRRNEVELVLTVH